MSGLWERVGAAVRVAPLTVADLPALRAAITESRDRIAAWGPARLPDPDQLADQGPSKRTFLVHALDSLGAHGIAARVDLNNTIGGRLGASTLGYDAFDPYAGRGLTVAGVRLVVEIAFAPPPHGLGLHRVEAGVQPANVRSAGLLRAVGFVREGFSPRLVYLPSGNDQREDWRDHDRYALNAEDWPAQPWRAPAQHRVVVLVQGVPGAGKSTLATGLARELGLPLLRKDAIKESVADALGPAALGGDPSLSRTLGVGASIGLWRLLSESPVGAVVESWWWPHDQAAVRDGRVRAGVDPARVLEVYCDVPVEVAAQAAQPIGVGPHVRVDTTVPVSDRDIVAIALQANAIARG